jgi:hypothetical protein
VRCIKWTQPEPSSAATHAEDRIAVIGDSAYAVAEIAARDDKMPSPIGIGVGAKVWLPTNGVLQLLGDYTLLR